MALDVIQHVPLEKFILDENVRARLNSELVEQIAHSFGTVGQLQPCRARRVGDLLGMVDGYHRHAAAVRAKWKMLATVIEGKELCEGEVIERQLISNCLRENLSAVDTARGIERLMEVTQRTASEAATTLGFSNSKVSELRKLLSLSGGILQLVQTGKIPASAAYELGRIDDPARQAELAGQLAAGQLTRDGLIGIRKAARKQAAGGGEASPVRATAAVGQGRTVTVSGPGLTLDSFIQVIEELLAKARKERTRGVELSTFIQVLRDQARTG